jgi:hypothetical protein
MVAYHLQFGPIWFDGKLLCEIDMDETYFDGHNVHSRKTEAYAGSYHERSYDSSDEALKLLPGAVNANACRSPACGHRAVHG